MEFLSMTPTEIFQLVSAKTGITRKGVQKVWENFVNLIISELQNVGEIRFEKFGKFEIVRRGGSEEQYIDEFGVKQRRFVDFYLSTEFTPSNTFIKHLNSSRIREKWSLSKIEGEDTLDAKVLGYVKPKEDRVKLLVTEDMKGKILELIRIREEKGDKINRWNQKIKCVENGNTYKSIRECALDLNINYQNLNNRYNTCYKKDKAGFKYDNYTFELIKNKRIGEEDE